MEDSMMKQYDDNSAGGATFGENSMQTKPVQDFHSGGGVQLPLTGSKSAFSDYEKVQSSNPMLNSRSPILGSGSGEAESGMAGKSSAEALPRQEAGHFTPETHKEESVKGMGDNMMSESREEQNRPETKNEQTEVKKEETTEAKEKPAAGEVKQASENEEVLVGQLNKLEEELTALRKELGSVKGSLDSIKGYGDAVAALKISLANSQKREDNIYKQLEAAKKDEYYTTIKPFLEYMVMLHLDLLKGKKEYEDDPENIVADIGEKAYKEIISIYNFQIESLESQLQIQGVSIEDYAEDSDYIAGEHMPRGAVETSDKEKNGKIAKVLSKGYKYNEKVLRKAQVLIYKFVS